MTYTIDVKALTNTISDRFIHYFLRAIAIFSIQNIQDVSLKFLTWQ